MPKKTQPVQEPREAKEITIAPTAPAPTLSTKKPFTKEQIALITRTVAKGATPDELALYLIVANKSGLDPFSKQIHFVKRKQKQKDGSYVEVGAIQTGIDGFRAIAERGGGYAGSDEPIYDTEEAKNPNKATVTVYKIIQGVRCPFTASARWTEYCPSTPMDFMWRKMPYLMLGKVAESLALRKAFPNDLSGIYVEEEMERTGAVVDASEVNAPKPLPVEQQLPGGIVEATAETVNPGTTKPANPLKNLFTDARSFGAKEGEEGMFIQEHLDKEINWELLKEYNIALLRTELKAKLTKRE